MYYVSRQKYYYSGETVVEVTSGGADYAGSDMLNPKYPGEAREYADPREAVEVAIAICRAWRKAGERKARVGIGGTGGMGIEIEPCSFDAARKRASEIWERLEKCGPCGNPLPEKRKRYRLCAPYDYTGDEFCSESCADREFEFLARHDTENENSDG